MVWKPKQRVGRYAVVFRERDEPLAAGSLELAEESMLLSGGSGDRENELEISFSEVAEVRVGRQPGERLNGSPTLVLERKNAPPVQVAPVGAGLAREIADLLLAVISQPDGDDQELTVIVPIRSGCLERARKLLELGPPLNPAMLGLTGHRVYLRGDEAVFVFAGPHVQARIRGAMRRPALWRAGIAWAECIAGQPYLADGTAPLAPETLAYTWPNPDSLAT